MFANQPQANIAPVSNLALTGGCGYEIQNDRVIINISEIANHRELENISGTLSIELWALDKPYTGADFNGLALAGTSIGELFGQHSLNNCRYDLNFQEPPAGTWYLTLMLREWTGMGYLTRDYVNFALPYIINNPAILGNRTDNVINVSFSGNKKSLATAAVTKATIPATGEAGNSGQGIAQNGTSVSLENASLEDDIILAEGNPNKPAENGNIDTQRPFESLDNVLKVKGMVPTLWKKIRDIIRL